MHLEEKDIKEMYLKYVLSKQNDDFKYKYCPLPFNENNKRWKWEGKDFPRVISLLEFKEFIEKNSLFFNDILCFNGDTEPEFEFLKYKNKTVINYEDDPKNNDLHKLNLNKQFDFIMLNQTLEHLYDPISVLKSIFNSLNNNGIFYCNVPAINIPHMTPLHYYSGFTPTGLGCLVKHCGFEILDIGFWGNKEYTLKMFNDNSWSDYRTLSSAINDFDYPLIAWIFAKKRV